MVSTARFINLDVTRITKRIRESNSVLLSTHKQCDGDGLGAVLGLYHALRKTGKNVRVITVDEIPAKYQFLEPDSHVENYENLKTPIEPTDVALIFDTNDKRLVEPLYSELEKTCNSILFIDHHPVLNQGPEPTPGSFIDTTAASTGEIAYFIIKQLGIRMDEKIARALYTSLAFDTQIFKFVKSSPNTHLICAELMEFEKHAERVHRSLFANYTRAKVTYIGKVMGDVEYFLDDRVALLRLSLKDLQDHDLDMDDTRDIIDMVMSINSVQCAALVREDFPNVYKLSLRSKGHVEVLSIAESFGGGGHLYAAGAEIHDEYKNIREKVIQQLVARMDS